MNHPVPLSFGLTAPGLRHHRCIDLYLCGTATQLIFYTFCKYGLAANAVLLAGIRMNIAQQLDLGMTPLDAASLLNESNDGQQAKESYKCPSIDILRTIAKMSVPSLDDPRTSGTNLGINYIPDVISLPISHDLKKHTSCRNPLLI
jgi:hypothetical protein